MLQTAATRLAPRQVSYDSDDPFDKMALANGCHATDEDINGVYLRLGPGEAAPELEQRETVFQAECRGMFGDFEHSIPGFQEAQKRFYESTDPQDFLDGDWW